MILHSLWKKTLQTKDDTYNIFLRLGIYIVKNSIVLWMLCIFSGFICVVNIGAADTLYPEDNVGMLYGYTPGQFTTTDSPTNLAIDGIGFFFLRKSGSNEHFYTKLGDFDFDDNGYLVSSHGHIVNGWEVSVDPETDQIELIGSTKDIQIPSVDKSNISIDENGTIFEVYGSDALPCFRFGLAIFQDPHRLEEVEDNYFKETSGSGAATTSLPGTNGLGTIENYSLEEIDPDFSYEADIWVDGDGYFVVSDPDVSDKIYYLASDAFRINTNGQMVSSGDLVVHGWKLITNDTTGEAESNGAVSEIEFFPNFTSPPVPSDRITVVANIDADSVNHSVGANALSLAWDGSLDLDSPIANSAYEHQVTASIYDSLGGRHDICIYFDNADTAQTVEFIMTCIPEEDMRFTSGPDTDAGHGLLGRGTISFTTEGIINDMAFERLVLSDPFDSAAWESQDVSTDLTNQHFSLVADFLGVVDTAMDIELDFGAGYNGSTWISDESSTTYNSQPSSTVSASSNGYGAQALARILIDEGGVITAYSSKGLVLPSFQVALASFEDESALNEVDSGIFEETSESGSPTVSPPNENGIGYLIFDEPEDVFNDSEDYSSDNSGCFINTLFQYK